MTWDLADDDDPFGQPSAGSNWLRTEGGSGPESDPGGDEGAGEDLFTAYIQDVYHSDQELAAAHDEDDPQEVEIPLAQPRPLLDIDPPDEEPSTDIAFLQDPAAGRWWRQTIVEICLLFGVVAIAEMYLRHGLVGMYGFEPHPYWLLILPIAAARGTVAALMAAAVGSMLWFMGGLQAAAEGRMFDPWDFDTNKYPLMFFATGFLVGEFRDMLARRYSKLISGYQQLRQMIGQLRRENHFLAQVTRELKSRIVEDSTQFGNLVNAATMMESATEGRIYDLALNMVIEHCGATMCSVLRVGEDASIQLHRQAGWDEDNLENLLAQHIASPYVTRAARDAIRINGLSPDETPPETGPLVVAAIADNDGMVKALLCLDELPAYRVNDTTVSLFFGIAEWIAASLKRISRGEKPFDATPALAELADSTAWIGTPEELADRLLIEDARGARMSMPGSVLAIQATNWTPEGDAEVDQLNRFLAQQVTTGIRRSDTLYQFGYAGCYVLVLPVTSVEGAGALRRRLARRFDFLDNPIKAPIQMTAFGPDDESVDLLGILPKLAAHFRSNSAASLAANCPVEVPTTTVVGDAVDFVRRLQVEIAIAQRHDRDLHVLEVFTDGGDKTAGTMLTRHIGQVAGTMLRNTDGIYTTSSDRCSVILPGCPQSTAEAISDRLTRALRECIPESKGDRLTPELHGLHETSPDIFLGRFLRGGQPSPVQEEDGDG